MENPVPANIRATVAAKTLNKLFLATTENPRLHKSLTTNSAHFDDMEDGNHETKSDDQTNKS
jgi:hypothetical protein